MGIRASFLGGFNIHMIIHTQVDTSNYKIYYVVIDAFDM